MGQLATQRTPSGPSSAKRAGAGPQQKRGPLKGNPNAMQGKASQLEQQRQDRSPKALDDTHVRGDTDNDVAPEQTLAGDTVIVDTNGSDLMLRDGPSTDDKILEKLPEGTVLTRHKEKAGWTWVKAYSGFGGAEGWVSSQWLLSQPDLTNQKDGDNKGKPNAFTYKEATGQPFHGKPNAAQATQGSIGDCYLIAALGAVAAQPAGQASLMKMIHPHTANSTYTVTFQEEQWDGSHKPQSVKVDLWMPANDGQLKFALKGNDWGDLETTPLWPAIIEKAYAQWKGGYDAIGDGGSPGGAMGELTGADVRNQYVSSFRDDESLLEAVKAAVEDGQALTAATKSKKHVVYETLKGTGAGPHKSKETNKATPGSVSIVDTAGGAPKITDDSAGKLSSQGVGDDGAKASGTVGYGQKDYKVDVSATYPDGFAPDKAGDLELRYEAAYWLSTTPKICANHAYIVDGVTETGIEILNPWGSYHPGEVPIKTFRDCYYSFAGAELLKADDPSA